jgi:hypothetical protein
MEDVDMFSEMRNCMGRMPWGEIQQLGDGGDSSWFKSEVRDGDGSHSFRIAASQAPPHLTLSTSSSQHGRNLDSRGISHTSEPEDVTVDLNVNSSASIGSQEEAGVPPDAMNIIENVDSSANIGSQEEARGPLAPDAMDIDEEGPATNLQTSSGNYRRMTLRGDKKIGEANVPEEREKEDNDEDSEEDDEKNSEEEIVRSPTQIRN